MSAATTALSDLGVAIWLDDLSRARLDTGTLAAMLADQDVVGVTTNPSIFQAAITGSDDYAADIAALKAEGADAEAIVRALTTEDVRRACELFLPTWEATGGQDGRVSIEVDPRLAHDTDATIAQATELWAEVDRPNLLIKIPATTAGLPAIRAVIAAGISVNTEGDVRHEVPVHDIHVDHRDGVGDLRELIGEVGEVGGEDRRSQQGLVRRDGLHSGLPTWTSDIHFRVRILTPLAAVRHPPLRSSYFDLK